MRKASKLLAIALAAVMALGFTGCGITDDMVMDAFQEYCDASGAAVQAVQAGNDLLCCSDYETQYPAVLAAVESGELSETVIGYRNNTYIGIDSTERVIGRFRTGFCQGIEESTFTHVGQAYNT